MSVRFDSSFTDRLVATFGSALTFSTVGHGINLAAWVKLKSDMNASLEVVFLGDQVSPSGTNRWGIVTDASGTGLQGYFGAGNLSTAYAASLDTWYYCVSSRPAGQTNAGGDTYLRFRVFADDGGMTKLLDTSVTGGSDTYTGMDTIVCGDLGGRNGAQDMELESVKLFTGAEWSDAECRTESQNYTIQKTGGTDTLAWKLTNTDADTDGLYEVGGGGQNLSNTGVVDGASTPSSLSAPTATLEQEGYRGLNDDGSESAATFAAAQDAGFTVTPGQVMRNRVVINATNDPDAAGYQYDYRKQGETPWIPFGK